MKINYNVSAMTANNSLKKSDGALANSIQRLSSGLKINRAKDNAAGLAIAKRMNAQLIGLSVANDNANDGVSVIETADGALSEVHDILQRINELAVKGSNGTITESDRQAIQDEVEQLKQGLEQIVQNTEFNGQKILDGSFDLRGYTDQNSVKVESYTDKVTAREYIADTFRVTLDADGNIAETVDVLNTQCSFAEDDGFPADCKVKSVEGNIMTIGDKKGFEISFRITDSVNVAAPGMKINITGFGNMSVQVGANEGQQLDMRIPDISLENIGINNTDFTTQEGCREALGKMDNAINYISSVRSRLGAYQNRLESTIDALDVAEESMTSAYSRIMDVDMAKEMTIYSNMQVLTQAGTSVLAQANERPSQVLQLLQ